MTKENNVHIPKTKAKKLIWKVLSSMPIDVFDDDEGSFSQPLQATFPGLPNPQMMPSLT